MNFYVLTLFPEMIQDAVMTSITGRAITDEKISLAVRPVKGELSKADVSKIRDVVLAKTTISSQNIVVVEVN